MPSIITRDLDYTLSDNALAILGPRRAGKTYFLFQITRDLMGSGWPRESIVYVNFEDIRLMGINPNHFSTFLKVVNELAREFRGRIVIMMNEAQSIPQWGRWVRSLLDRRRYHVVITGSSSKLGIAEIPTELRDRYIQRLLLPFSFREYLRARGFETRHLGAPEQLGKLLGLLRDYITHGDSRR